jgi:hypothetical protein
MTGFGRDIQDTTTASTSPLDPPCLQTILGAIADIQKTQALTPCEIRAGTSAIKVIRSMADGVPMYKDPHLRLLPGQIGALAGLPIYEDTFLEAGVVEIRNKEGSVLQRCRIA